MFQVEVLEGGPQMFNCLTYLNEWEFKRYNTIPPPSSSHGKNQFNAVYFIKHISSGKIYVGSTSDIYKRIIKHKHMLRNNSHSNLILQELYNSSDNIEYYYYITENREKAYEYEQKLLNDYRDSNLLINIAVNAKSTWKDRLITDKERQNISLKQKQLWSDPEYRKKQTERLTGRKYSSEALARFKEQCKNKPLPENLKLAAMQIAIKNKKPVIINGQKYESVKEAAKSFSIDPSLVIFRCRSNTESFKNWKYLI